jgi:hypothetical protein
MCKLYNCRVFVYNATAWKNETEMIFFLDGNNPPYLTDIEVSLCEPLNATVYLVGGGFKMDHFMCSLDKDEYYHGEKGAKVVFFKTFQEYSSSNKDIVQSDDEQVARKLQAELNNADDNVTEVTELNAAPHEVVASLSTNKRRKRKAQEFGLDQSKDPQRNCPSPPFESQRQ